MMVFKLWGSSTRCVVEVIMKPRLSRSRDRERVRGECGDPARTTTSVLVLRILELSLESG